MDVEDGVIWVYGVGEDGVMAFNDFGIEKLMELVKMHREDQTPQALRSENTLRPTQDGYEPTGVAREQNMRTGVLLCRVSACILGIRPETGHLL